MLALSTNHNRRLPPPTLPMRTEDNDPHLVKPANMCSIEEHIHSPVAPVIVSFDWSDFPVIGQSLEDNPELDSCAASSLRRSCIDDAGLFCSSAPRPALERTPQHMGATRVTPPETSTPSLLRAVGSSSSPSLRTPRHKKTVSFSKLEIREHALIVGDHPCCQSGLPLSLGWEHSAPTLVDLDEFESSRVGMRRTVSEMRMTYYERKNVLKRIAGLTESDLARAERRRQSQIRREAAGSCALHHVPSVSLMKLA